MTLFTIKCDRFKKKILKNRLFYPFIIKNNEYRFLMYNINYRLYIEIIYFDIYGMNFEGDNHN